MPRADRVPFLFQRPIVAVRATLHDREDVTLVVDTGAERTVISQRVAVRLGLDLDRPLRLQPLAGVGQSPPVPVVRLDRVQIGASAVVGLEASVYDLPAIVRADGLLGLNFLRRLRVTFAFDTGLLILREPTQKVMRQQARPSHAPRGANLPKRRASSFEPTSTLLRGRPTWVRRLPRRRALR